jgi:thymidylate synthase
MSAFLALLGIPPDVSTGGNDVGAPRSGSCILSTPASAQDYIPQLSTTTGQEIGRAFRTDGKVPTKDGAKNDRLDCVLNQISEQQAKRLALLARKDKAAGETALLRAVTPCMAKKGWRIEVTGR